MNVLQKKAIHGEFFRFLLVGASNTALGYLLFLLLIKFFAYLYAYSISYCIGIVYSYILNALFVFKKKLALRSFLQFPIVYIIQYCLGVGILWLLVGKLGVAPALAMLIVIVVTVPITFLASRFVLKN